MRPRWRKVFRDLSSHWFRTMLVVVSIAIGIFAVGVMLGGREVLLREFEADFEASVPADVTYRTMDFGAGIVAQAESEPDVAAVQARRSVNFRYTWEGSKEDRSRCNTSGKRVVTLDLNQDKQPDVWKIYAVKSEGGSKVEVLTCKEQDRKSVV